MGRVKRVPHAVQVWETVRSTEGDEGSTGHEELWVRTPEWKGLFLSRSPFFSLFLPSLPSFPPQMIFFSLSCLILPLLLDPFSLHVLAFSFPLFHLFSSPFTLSHVEWDNITKYCIYWIKMLYPNVFNIEIKCVKAFTCFSRRKKTDDTKLLVYFNMTLCALFFGMVTLNGKHSLPNSTSLSLGVKIIKISVSAVTWRNDFAFLILLCFIFFPDCCPLSLLQKTAAKWLLHPSNPSPQFLVLSSSLREGLNHTHLFCLFSYEVAQSQRLDGDWGPACSREHRELTLLKRWP